MSPACGLLRSSLPLQSLRRRQPSLGFLQRFRDALLRFDIRRRQGRELRLQTIDPRAPLGAGFLEHLFCGSGLLIESLLRRAQVVFDLLCGDAD